MHERTLSLLIVEDDELFVSDLKTFMNGVLPFTIGGVHFTKVTFDNARNQADAERLASLACPHGYDIVLLDLRYPLSPTDSLPTGDASAFQGMKWLPELRRLQPHSAIVVVSSYASQDHLINAVAAIRDYHADDFVPKSAPLRDIFSRIQMAWANARRVQHLLMLQREFRSLLRSHAARIYSEDVATLLERAKTEFMRIATQIESGDTGAVQSAPERIRAECRFLRQEFLSLSSLVNAGKDRSRRVDVGDVVSQIIQLYQRQIEEIGAGVVDAQLDTHVVVTTFECDLKIALHEILSNAIDSLTHSSKPPGKREIMASVAAGEKSAIIRICDNGNGFSNEAVAEMFKLGYSTHEDDRHQGIGLYIARRMMQSMGGSILPGNREGGGAEVILTVRDLSQ